MVVSTHRPSAARLLRLPST